ncbi:Cdc37 N-terminal domain [Trinorchestia longiramus]|nr:Cdc37 N-terminal domain [Trinorchestia longiramus]
MVDYSKWKDIEISDDEDDTHPNIDTPSLFRWRHQARVERMAEKEKEKQQLEEEKRKYEARVQAVRKQLQDAESCKDASIKQEKKRAAEKQLLDLQTEMEKVQLKHKELEKKEKLEPWNVDTISKEGFDKSLINKEVRPRKDNLTEEEREQQMRNFIKKNEKLIKQYGMFRHYDDSKRFMMEHPDLACEHTANYLVIWCINLQLEEKGELMRHVAHQSICLQFILELAGQLDRDPRSCISAFFVRIQQAEPEYLRAFKEELAAFISRIEKRAKEKIEEAQREVEEEERQKRLGPGGLDPFEVLEELPEELRACFESQDLDLLKTTIAKMPPAEAAQHMKRCVASGLWVPEGGTTDHQTGLAVPPPQEEEEEEEEEVVVEVTAPVPKIEDTVD